MNQSQDTQFLIAQTLTSAQDIEQRLQQTVDILASKYPTNVAVLVLLDLVRRKTNTVIMRGNLIRKLTPEVYDHFQTSIGDWVISEILGNHNPDDSWAKLLDNYQDDLLQQLNIERLITAPILYRRHFLGILGLAYDISQKEEAGKVKSTLTSVAYQIALALEVERLRNADEQQQRHANALRELTRLLNYRLDQQQVLELIVDKLAEVISYDSASIMLKSGDLLSIVAYRKFRSTEQLELPKQIEALPHIKQVLKERKPVIIADTMQDPRWHKLQHSNYIRCWMGVPLIAGKDIVIGLINLDKEEPGFYTKMDSEIAFTFANQAAIAIENARLYVSERQRVDQMDALRATIADISSELELSKLLDAILRRAMTLLDANGGELGIFDSKKEEIEIVVSHNMGQDYIGTRIHMGEGAMGLAVETGKAVLIDDYASWENASPQYKIGPFHSVVAVPILLGGRVLGAIAVIDRRPQRTFNSSDTNLLSLFAQHAAIAIENARLYKSTKDAVDRMAILHQVSQTIVTASLELDEIYTAIHQATGQLMPAEAFVISLNDPKTKTIEAVYLYDRSGRLEPQSIPNNQGLSSIVITEGKSVYLPDTLVSAPENLVHFGDAKQIRSVLAVPIRLRGEGIGMLSTQSYQPDAFSKDDLRLLELLSAYAAIAIDNTRLLMKIQTLAITDSLTEIFNRRHLFTLGEREFLRSQRFNRPLSAIMIDIDHFKQVNDEFGHAAGDIVLRSLAQFMKSQLRETDIIGRYGGEEFVLILPETKSKDAMIIARRLLKGIQSQFDPGIEGLDKITVSMGITEISSEVQNFTSLLEQADRALYIAKEAGRNRVKRLEVT